jgi:CubicO group peptidase (beta-lactamase class C family)
MTVRRASSRTCVGTLARGERRSGGLGSGGTSAAAAPMVRVMVRVMQDGALRGRAAAARHWTRIRAPPLKG